MYRFEARIIGRSQGKSATKQAAHNTGKRNSAVAAAAYLSRSELTDAKGNTYDYSHHFGGAGAQLLLPQNAPDWMRDRGKLWTAIESVEKRKDSMLARDFIITMPYGLSEAQMWACVKDFAREQFVSKGKPVDIGLHIYGEPWGANATVTRDKVRQWKEWKYPFYELGKVPKNDHGPHVIIDRWKNGNTRRYYLYQPHMHVMTTFRAVDPQSNTGFARHKDSVTAGNWHMQDKAYIKQLRKDWSDTLNRHLEAAGLPERVDHRSLKDQGIDRKPEPKKGPIAAKMEREDRGNESAAIIHWQRVREYNRLNAEVKRIEADIIDLREQRRRKWRMEIEREDILSPKVQQKEVADQREMIAKAERQMEFAERFRVRFHQDIEEADERKRARQRQEDLDAQAGDIADARARELKSIEGADGSLRSLAEAVAREGALFQREQEARRKEMALEKDPDKREAIQLKMKIEAAEYFAITSDRLKWQSRIITGRSDSAESQRQEQRHEYFTAQAVELRKELKELTQTIRDKEVAFASHTKRTGLNQRVRDMMNIWRKNPGMSQQEFNQAAQPAARGKYGDIQKDGSSREAQEPPRADFAVDKRGRAMTPDDAERRGELGDRERALKHELTKPSRYRETEPDDRPALAVLRDEYAAQERRQQQTGGDGLRERRRALADEGRSGIDDRRAALRNEGRVNRLAEADRAAEQTRSRGRSR
jgi:hypothetical protein